MFDLMTNKLDRLVVLQSKAQSEHYQNTRRMDGDIVLPIGPEAMYETDINGWAFCTLGDLWSGDQLEKEKNVIQKRLDDLIETLNDYSRRWNPELGLEIGNYYAFQLWVIINQIQYNNFFVRCIAENIKPSKILCYTKAKAQVFMELRPDPDCLFADVLSRSALWKNGICEIVRINENDKINTLREIVLAALPVSVRAILRKIRDKNGLKSTHSATYNLLIIGAGGDWIKLSNYSDFVKEFRLHLPPELISADKVKPEEELSDIISNSIQRDGLVPFDISGLASAIQSDLHLFAKKAEEIRDMMMNYDAIVTSVLTFPRDNFLAHIAALVGRPVVVWQHGEKGQSGLDPVGIYTELFYATDYFAYAPVVVKQYEAFLGKYRLNSVVAVGSIEKNVVWQGGNTIVYATGKWFKNGLLSDPDRRLYEAHKSILGYLENIGNRYSIIMKANNTPGLNDIPYRLNKVDVEYVKPFTELLKTAKIVILDTPATTLIEACSTKIPIFVLGGRTEYTHEFLLVIKRRVVWSETPEDLVRHIATFLEAGTYNADVNDQTFLLQYGAGTKATQVVKTARACLLDSINYSNSLNQQL